MDKIIVISDSFKGSLSSKDIVDVFTSFLSDHHINMEMVSFPIADGGEGTVEAFANVLEGELVETTAHDSYMNKIKASYFVTKDNEAIIEMASCAGLTQVSDNKNPSKTTTFGVGELIKHAIDRGIKTIYLGLGGSSTNDGGCGAASALGIKFLNQNNESFIPVGGTLKDINSIKIDNNYLKNTEIRVLSDVNNPMYGPDGAAFVYAKQKGADELMIQELDEGLIHLSEVIKKDLKKDVSTIPGAGAAGAFGAGSVAFFNAKIASGIDSLLKICHFEESLEGASFVFTGEGKMDYQTLKGKAIFGISKVTKRNNIPLIVIAGAISNDITEKDLNELGIKKMYAIGEGYSLEYSMKNAKTLYYQKLEKVFADLTEKPL